MKQTWSALVLAAVVSGLVSACLAADGDAAPAPVAPAPATQTVVDVLRGDATYALFVQALESTGLDQTLRGPGPYIVFAPTDEAFKRMPNFADVQKNPELLKTICKYHIVPFGKTQSKDLPELKFAVTMQGEEIHFSKDKSLQVNDATVVQTDLNAGNGVVHGIDRVLLPRSIGNLKDVSIITKEPAAPIVKEPTQPVVVRDVITNEGDAQPVVTQASYVETSEAESGGVVTGTAHTVYDGVKHGTYKVRKFFSNW